MHQDVCSSSAGWEMAASSREGTWSALLSIAWSQPNLKGHQLTPNFLAPAGLGCSFRLGLRETVYWPLLLINAFSACLQPAHKPHVGVDLPALDPYSSLFLYLQQMKHSDGKTPTSIGLWVHYFEWHFINGVASWKSNEAMVISIQV